MRDWSELRGNHLARRFTRGKICFEHLNDRRGPWAGSYLEHLLYCTWDVHECDTTFEERCDGNLVGCIEGDGRFASGFSGFVGQAKAGEAVEVGLREVELTEHSEVEGQFFFFRYGDSLRVRQRVQNGQAHVGDGDLREDAAVDELN